MMNGYIVMRRGDVVLYDGPNLVVDAAYEVLQRAAMQTDYIRRVEFSDLGGKPVAASMRTLTSVVGTSDVGTTGDQRPLILQNGAGQRAVGRWLATFTAPSAIAYDTLGLVASSGLLFAVRSIPRVTLAKGESITVDWTINLAS